MTSPADDVLAHSADPDEWDEEPVAIEVRPGATQVISARLPEALALRALDEATRRGIKPSQLVREALENLLGDGVGSESVNVYSSGNAHLWPAASARYEMESPLVLTVLDEHWEEGPSVVALGYAERRWLR